jgi:hypothetical protein
VEKTKMSLSIKSQNSEDYKNEYANQLQKTNALQVSSDLSYAVHGTLKSMF